jgi:hypothetical protein
MLVLSLSLLGCGGGGDNDEEAEISSDASLSELSLSEVELDQAVEVQQTTYSASVEATQDSVNLTAVATNGSATIQVNGSDLNPSTNSVTLSLAEGENLITLLVTAADGVTTQTYTLTVTRSSGEADNSVRDTGVSISMPRDISEQDKNNIRVLLKVQVKGYR